MSISELDAKHVWHPYTQHLNAIAPVEIVRAEGAYLYGSNGQRIIDAISSWWVTLHGHAQREITAAIGKQATELEQVIFAGFTHQPAVKLAEELLKVLPSGLSRIFYSDNGSTAVEVAIKMAIQYWQNTGEERKTIVTLENAYHGDTFGTMSASARGLFTAPFKDYLFDVTTLPDPVGGDPVGSFTTLLSKLRPYPAAIIVEPLILGAGGMRIYNADVLKRLYEVAKQHGVLFIADEVMTGFGRTGPLFACEHAKISPDIICLSKGITGGFMPLGATVTREEIFSAFLSNDRKATFFHGHSYTANPISCSAALASLQLLNEESAQKRRDIENAHKKHLPTVKASNKRTFGTIAAFDIAFDIAQESNYLDPIGPRLASYALEHGVLLRPLGNVVYIMPPYCTTPDEIGYIYEVTNDFIATL
jgi:adenosylmethionine-8-amino-7-oxononanoate aminotransferase